MPLRRIAWAVLAVLLCAHVAGAQTRTVAVTFDDSGSMGNPQDPAAPWRYANYALQTLVGLMSPQDALAVVRMSTSAKTEPVDLSAQGAQIGLIRSAPHLAAQQTPYEAVQTAAASLVRAAEDEARTGAAPSEKWLIIITDGQFVDRPLTPDEDASLTREIRDFVQRTGARTVLLLIGEIGNEVMRVWEREAQARRYEARDRSEIAVRMREIAAEITSRSTQRLNVGVGGSRASFATELPLRRITLMQQGEQPGLLAPLRSARSGGRELDAAEPLLPAMPLGSADPVHGRIDHVRGKGAADAVIPEGAVRLDFGQPPDPARLQVLPEVAARLAVSMADAQGRPLPDRRVHDVCEGDSVRVRATLLSPGGDTLVRLVRRPADFRVAVEYAGRTTPLAAAQGGGYFEHVLKPGRDTLAVSASAAYPGYFNYRSQIFTVRGVGCRPRVLAFAPVAPWSHPVTRLDEAPPALLVPTADGMPIPPDELEGWTFTRTDGHRLKVDVERTPLGWTLKPRKTWGLACCTPTGTIPVQVEARSTRSSEAPLKLTVPLTVEDVGFWRRCGWLVALVLAALLLAWYLIRILRKRRFCPGSEVVYQRAGRSTSRPFTHGLPGKNVVARWLWPSRAERTAVEGIVFEPGLRCSYIVLPAKSQGEDMFVAGERIEDPGRRDVRIAQGDALEVRKAGRRESYTYQNRST